MSSPDEFLTVPSAYARWFGGLRWSDDGEAVEYVERETDRERTFAFAGEIAPFLEGFQNQGPPACFGFLLHMMHLTGIGRRSSIPPERLHGRQPSELRWLFRDLGRPLRNAGALWAVVCREIPRAADPPPIAELCARLTQRPTMIALRRVLGLVDPSPEVPPLSPLSFEARVLRALASIPSAEVREWLRTGRPPIGEVGDDLARESEGTRSRSLVLALAALEQRPRLRGAARLVPQLDAALTLPARRLSAAELPAGGYADIGTSGRPEQILPSQFALDAEEFLRRLAEKELLYYQREEPKLPVGEEVWLLIDQGIRAWGDVRLILAASALALARRVLGRGQTLRVATTSDPTRLVDPAELSESSLEDLFESSDLSPDPGELLSAIRALPSGVPRDLVLLTHPRALDEPAVRAAARGIAAPGRLFAVAVDGLGEVTFSEVRDGVAIRLGRSRVDLVPAPSAAEPPEPAVRGAPWTGSIESIGYPFDLGVVETVGEMLFDFDRSAEWLFLAGPIGRVDAWRLDGTVHLSLPRPTLEGRPIDAALHLVGVAGGVALLGRCRDRVVLAHYDLASRRCRVHELGIWSAEELQELTYYNDLHTVVWHSLLERDGYFVVDLAAESGVSDGAGRRAVTDGLRARIASGRSRRWTPQPSRTATCYHWRLRHAHEDGDDGESPANALPPGIKLSLEPLTGDCSIAVKSVEWPPIQPRIDGRPALKGWRVGTASAAGPVVAASFVPGPAQSSDHPGMLLLFDRQDSATRTIATIPRMGAAGFALSRDGSLLAHKVGDRQVEVCEVRGGSIAFATPRGKIHSQVTAELGDDYVIIRAGEQFHLVEWTDGTLRVRHGQGSSGRQLLGLAGRLGRKDAAATRSTAMARPPFVDDPARFRSWCRKRLILLIDVYSQLVLLDGRGDLVAVMMKFRDRFAAWLPDGTRLGSRELLGGEPTPHAAARIGHALLRATREVGP